MKLATLLNRIETLSVNGSLQVDVTSIAYDSRKVAAGALFVALPGAHANGALFCAQAAGAGAVAVLTQEDVRDTRLPVVVVKDARAAMAERSRGAL